MRTFLITIFLFICLVAIIIGNAFYIHHLAAQMETMLDTLPARAMGDENATILALEKKWHGALPFISLSVGAEEINRIGETIAMIGVYYEEENDAEYHAACTQLRLALDDLCRFERIPFGDKKCRTSVRHFI